MRLSDLLEEVYFSLSSNKVRSSLTILGIVIGIGSVISLISIGQGTASDITSRVESLGSNLLVVSPGAQRGVGSVVRNSMGSSQTLVLEDSDAILAEVDNLLAVAPTVSSRKQVSSSSGTNTNTSIYGVMANYQTVKNITVSSGSFITDIHNSNLSKVAVIGPDTSTTLFGEGVDPVGQKIRIDNLQFTIIGITESLGGSTMGSSDDLIYVPLTTAQRYFTGSKSLSNISIQVDSTDNMTIAEEDINALLLSRHGIASDGTADFSIMNQADLLETMSSVSTTLTLLLGAIAGISLLVGGIGIMNMMLTTVTERTREIGLRKAIGAKSTDISSQFLAESVALTFIGGIIGITLGWLVSQVIGKYADMTTVVSLKSVVLAFGVSSLIGIVFGYYPARRAAKLSPIEALRYE